MYSVNFSMVYIYILCIFSEASSTLCMSLRREKRREIYNIYIYIYTTIYIHPVEIYRVHRINTQECGSSNTLINFLELHIKIIHTHRRTQVIKTDAIH